MREKLAYVVDSTAAPISVIIPFSTWSVFFSGLIVANGIAPEGEALEGPGAYYKPTVIADVDQKAEIVQREVFGPVVSVQRFRDEDQAVRLRTLKWNRKE